VGLNSPAIVGGGEEKGNGGYNIFFQEGSSFHRCRKKSEVCGRGKREAARDTWFEDWFSRKSEMAQERNCNQRSWRGFPSALRKKRGEGGKERKGAWNWEALCSQRSQRNNGKSCQKGGRSDGPLVEDHRKANTLKPILIEEVHHGGKKKGPVYTFARR